MADPELQAFADTVLVILVLYKADLESSNSFKTLAFSCASAGVSLDLFVYDNSPQPQATPGSHSPLSVSYLHSPSNQGVSAAYNAGALLAKEMGRKWLLLLDQDTIFPPEAVANYARGVSSSADVALFAPRLMAGTKLLSPCGYLAGIGYHLGQVHSGVMALHHRAILNSGMLLQLTVFEACGGYDEKVRVDFADFAFMNRFRTLCKKVAVLDIVCQHGFSNLEAVSLETALRRFADYCSDGRAAAVTPLLKVSHALLVLRRCTVLTMRYYSPDFMARLPEYFTSLQGKTPS